MPQNKKVFQIVINGLTESVDAVKSLNSQLDDLEERIKRLQNAKVEVKVSGNTNETTNTRTTVSGNKGSTNASKQLTEEQRLQNQIAKEQQRNEALLTQEYQNQLAALTRIKNENKEITKDIAQQTSGVKDMNGEYANTLAGQRAYLSELKSQLANVELGTDEWERLGQEVLRVNTNVKQLEESYGVFTRNVGNYKSAAQGFKELTDGTKVYENNLRGLNAQLNDLNDKWQGLEKGSDEFNKTAQEIRDLTAQIRDLQAQTETAGNAMEERLGVKFQTTIGGIKYTFDDVNQGIGLLEDKLYSMAQAGDTTSNEFRDIQQEVVRLKNSVIQTDAAIDSMVGTSKGLRNVLSIFTGFTGIAGIGQGLMGLFGGQNAELDESIQKFTSLTLILTGLQALQVEMNQNVTAFGRLLNTTNESINKFLSTLGKIPGIKAFKSLNDDLKEINRNSDLAKNFTRLDNEINKTLSASNKLKAAFENLSEEAKNIMGGTVNRNGLNNLSALNQQGLLQGADAKGVQEFLDAFEELKKTNPQVAKQFQELDIVIDQVKTTSGRTAQSLGNMNTWLGKLAASSPLVARGLNLVAASISALAKATVVLAIIQALMLALEKLGDVVEKVWNSFKNWTGDTGKTISRFDLTTQAVDRQNEAWDRLNKTIEDNAKMMQRSRFDTMNEQMAVTELHLLQAQNELQKFILELGRLDKLENNLNAGSGFFSVGTRDIKSVEEFRKEYEKLYKAVQQGKDRFDGKGFGGLWNTVEDAQEDLAAMQEAVLKDFQFKLSRIDMNDAENAIKQFRELMDDEMYASSFANIDKLFPDEEWAKTLKALVNNYQNAIDQMNDKTVEFVEQNNEAAKQLRDLNTYNMQFEPGQWRFGYERQLLKDKYEDERKAAEGNAELLAAIDKKYHNERKALIRKQAQEIKQINFQIQEDNLAAQKEGLDKEIAQLNLAREQEINAAKQTDINVNEQILAINKNYDAQILKLKKDFYKQQVDAADERNKQLLEQEQQFLEQDLQMQRQISQLRNANNMQSFENENHNITSTITYDVNVTGGEGLNERKAYYDKLLQLQRDYIDKKEQMDIEAAKQQTSYDLEDSEKQYQDQLKSLEDFYKQQKDLMDDSLEQGLMSQKEYNTEMAALKKQLADQEAKLQENANAQQIAIVKQGENEITRIMNEANDKRVEANSEYLKQMTDNLNEYYKDINSNRLDTTKKNTNSLGIINYKKEKENLQNTQKEYQNLLSNIDKEYSSLQSKLDNNEISFNDFKQAKDELDSLRQKTEENVKATQNALDNLVNKVAGSVLNMINGYMSAFGDIWNMVSELRSNSIDAEEERLERQQEILDEELEAIEEAYEAQEEATQKHRDKINDIEGELSTARGDRRQALIDQLAKERDAELKSLQAEQDIQKKKQANEKKQQALEKQKEALEKKRWQQDKQNKIVQATINTFTAVSNALAVQPWFVGLALSSVALALGMANVSKIASQKYMKDGGLLNGKSHAQGGIPVGTTGIEVEGNEYVINKNTTMKNLPLLEYINSQRRPLTKEDLSNFYDDKKGNRLITKSIGKFADGGQLPSGLTQADLRRLINYQPEEDNRQIVVSVVDIVNASEDLRKVQVLSGLTD